MNAFKHQRLLLVCPLNLINHFHGIFYFDLPCYYLIPLNKISFLKKFKSNFYRHLGT